MVGKPTKKILSKRLSGRIAGAALFVLGAFVFLRAYIADLADVFTVWATIVLAGVAVFSFEESRRLRKQYKEREENDRKERLLNEIIEWTIDVAGWNFKLYNFIEAQISKEPWVESSIGEIVSQFQVIEVKGDYINNIALDAFKNEGKLSTAVKAVNKEIRELVDVSTKRLDGEVTTEAVMEHVNLLRSKLAGLLKEAAKIRARDIT